MSAQGGTMISQSSTAVVIDVETFAPLKGTTTPRHAIKVEYIDVIRRPDLAGKRSTWIDVESLPAINGVVTVEFAPKRGPLGATIWAPKIFV